MILDKYVKVVLNSSNIKHFEKLGYEIPRHKDKKGRMRVKLGTEIIVKVSDLTSGSHCLVNVECDICGKQSILGYRVYLKNAKKYNLYTCKDCSLIKTEKTCLEKYGVKSPSQNQEVYNKIKKTNMDRYGHSSAMQNSAITNKVRQTNIERYGVESASQRKEIQEKIKRTNLEKYGHENYLQSDDFKIKAINTYRMRYGENVTHNMQIPEVREKVTRTLYANGHCAVSKQQKYLNELFGTELNYPFMNYNFDMYDLKNKIDIEYDGSGHDKSVALGQIDMPTFKRKEIVREIYSKLKGIKVMRIVSRRDKLPSDDVLLHMFEISKKLLRNNRPYGISVVKWDIDNSCYYTYPNKSKVEFDYGVLKRLR